MKHKSLYGNLISVLVAVIPVSMWLIYKLPGFNFSSWSNIADGLARIFGITGLSLFSFNVILSGRLKIFDKLFFGLDKMYRVHHKLGAFTLIFLLAHFEMLAISYSLTSFASAYEFMISFSDIALVIGKISLFLMIGLLIFTFYVRSSYKTFVMVHRFLGTLVFVVGYHAMFVKGSDVRSIPPLAAYFVFMGLVSIIIYVYRSIFHGSFSKKFTYEIVDIIKHKNIVELKLKPLHDAIKFYAGQFSYIKFNSNNISKESHPFTISAGSEDIMLRYCIKNSGDFTKDLAKLEIGDKAVIEGPYGSFSFTKTNSTNQIWIAGGIGITPFLSMAHSLPNSGYSVDIYYSAKTKEELVFAKELIQISKNIKKFNVHLHVSGDNNQLTAESISNLQGDVSKSAILICGPGKMMRDIKSQFINIGVNKKNIYTEEFRY